MPPKKGKEREKRLMYNESQLKEAVSAVTQKRMSMALATRTYEVPVGTVKWHIANPSAPYHGECYTKQLTLNEELAVVEYCQDLARMGRPLRRADIRANIQVLIRTSKRQSRFNLENGPSDAWFRRFFKRHPTLKESRPTARGTSRAHMTKEQTVDQHFNFYEQTLEQHGLEMAPDRIFNVGESGFGVKASTNTEKVIGMATKAMKTMRNEVGPLDLVTLTMCVSAAGRVLPAHWIYEKSLPIMANDYNPERWRLSSSPHGDMDNALFVQWFQEIFLKHCGTSRPVLLILDNQKPHHSAHIKLLAAQNQVVLFGLPRDTTHFLQPLDVGIFDTLKAKFRRINANKDHVIKRDSLPQMWRNVQEKYCTDKLIMDSFKKCGLVPFDPLAIHRKFIGPTERQIRLKNMQELIKKAKKRRKDAEDERKKKERQERKNLKEAKTSTDLSTASHNTTPTSEQRGSVIAVGLIDVDATLDSELGLLDRHQTKPVASTSEVEEVAIIEQRKQNKEKDEQDGNCCNCKQDVPPAKLLGRRRNIEWIECEKCLSWFHTLCLRLKNKPNKFKCEKCMPYVTARKNKSQSTKVVAVSDGHSFFRSIAVSLNKNLQDAVRNGHDVITDNSLAMLEESTADQIRIQTMSYMYQHLEEYEHLDPNSGMPAHEHFASLQERITQMNKPTRRVGELEISAASHALSTPIHILTRRNLVFKYGGDSESAIRIVYHEIAGDVGHYNALV